jgi:hypothetical protein
VSGTGTTAGTRRGAGGAVGAIPVLRSGALDASATREVVGGNAAEALCGNPRASLAGRGAVHACGAVEGLSH